MVKLSSEIDKVCFAKASEAQQGHVFAGWEDLSPDAQRGLMARLASVDFQLVHRLVRQYLHVSGEKAAAEERILKPAAAVRLPCAREEVGTELLRSLEAGEDVLRTGKVALFMLSGGAGTGPDGEATGLVPIGPVSGKSLFQLQAEKIRAANRRYKVSLPWTIVTHPDSYHDVKKAFREARYFGLKSSDVTFLPQPLLPLVDRRGKFILTEPGCLAMAPSGHGGVLLELLKPESLKRFDDAGIEHVVFFQVNNPLVRIPDPLFLGHHIVTGAEVTSKAVRRTDPNDEVGVFCQLSGSTGVVEYSRLSDAERCHTEPDGSMTFSSGNMAFHVFSTTFLRRLVRDSVHVPFHLFNRTLPCLNRRQARHETSPAECHEFRCFLFDVLWSANRTNVVEVDRAAEFSPIKNPHGERSPQTAKRDLSRMYLSWLFNCGATLDPQASPASHCDAEPIVEISPLFANDEDELREKLELPYQVRTGSILGA